MSDAQALTDLELEKIQQALDLKPEDTDPEQRCARRFYYPRTGQFAPWSGHGSTNGLTFIDVRFHDLSQTGVSFIVRRPLRCEYGVVRLKNPPGQIEVLVEVRHVTRQESDASEYLIGCRFLRRL